MILPLPLLFIAILSILHPVLVDDTDPAIQYGLEGWFVADVSKLNNGTFGPVFNGTSHATVSSNSTLSYPFTGTSIIVYGTIDVSTDANNVTDPTWNCFLDGIQIPSQTLHSTFQRTTGRCVSSPILPPPFDHSSQVAGQPFYFDSLVYTPAPDAVLPSAVLVYNGGDPALKYSPGWNKQLMQTDLKTRRSR
ncbi:hypothetical protein B0H17DRAFT_1145045 [Mycena rosella]|uniref:Uncharacterized protein n=1 Tax=Mycena rosella TaxID=1033263 RepID=A0AAD7CRX1_MYCRO|nr:hypothetical protein B0H17DRAFT_1145045 [Mycena rosella]